MYLSVKLSYYFASFHLLCLKIDVPAHISFTCVLNKTEMAINHHEGREGKEGEIKLLGEDGQASLKRERDQPAHRAEINISQTLCVLFFSSNSRSLSEFSSFA